MYEIVKHYPDGVGRTGRHLNELIKGSAFFPAGPGAKCGDGNGGPLPKYFPEKPIMFIAHNWGNQRMLDKAQYERGEATEKCWARSMDFLREADLDPERCFFTNALMGIKDGPAVGEMSNDPDYRKECEQYLSKQIELVDPSCIVSLGGASKRLCRRVYRQYGLRTEIVNIMHPSEREGNRRDTYAEWVRSQATEIRELLARLDPSLGSDANDSAK